MKSISILALTILFSNVKANCQITKGNWLVGGNANFSSSKLTSDIGSNTATTVQISGNIGYFLVDKLSGGIKPSYYFYNYKDNNNQSGQHNFSFGPFIRYYFLPTEQRVNIFAEGAYAYGIGKVATQKAISSNQFSFLAGPVIFLNDIVGIEFTFGYSIFKSADIVHNQRSVFQIGVGFQIHLEKE